MTRRLALSLFLAVAQAQGAPPVRAVPVAPTRALPPALFQSPKIKDLERSEGRYLWLLPELKVSAQTTGSAEFQLRGAAVWGLWKQADLLFWPIAKVQTTDGLATLINIDSSASTTSTPSVPWRLGVALGYMHFGEKKVTPIAEVHERFRRADERCRVKCPNDKEPFCKARTEALKFRERKATDVAVELYCAVGREELLVAREKLAIGAAKACQDVGEPPNAGCSKWKELYADQEIKARESAFDTCFASCDGTEATGFCHAAIGGPPYEVMDTDDMCDEGKEIVKQLRDVEALLPPLVVSAGAIAGMDGFSYYEKSKSDATLLVEKKDARRFGLRGGVLVTVVPSRWGTFEAGGIFEHRADASTTSLRFCSPKGNLVRPEQKYDAADSATFDVASNCKDSVLGAPTKSNALELLAEYGITGAQGIGWRIAAGPHVKVTKEDGSSLKVQSISIQIPLYIDLQALPKEYGAYRGLLRLTPAIERFRDSDGDWQHRFTLTLAVLAQRTLFGVVADAL